MKIMGIDPGLAAVGWGIVDHDPVARRVRHVAHGVIKTTPDLSTARRLQIIFQELSAVIREHTPEAVSIEELFFGNNTKTAIAVAQGRGVAILATAEADLALAEYSPPKIKLALVGYGRATKLQVQQMVRSVLDLDEIPQPDHAADALAAALCYLHSLGSLARFAEAASDTDAAFGARSGDKQSDENKALLAQVRPRSRRRGR